MDNDRLIRISDNLKNATLTHMGAVAIREYRETREIRPQYNEVMTDIIDYIKCAESGGKQVKEGTFTSDSDVCLSAYSQAIDNLSIEVPDSRRNSPNVYADMTSSVLRSMRAAAEKMLKGEMAKESELTNLEDFLRRVAEHIIGQTAMKLEPLHGARD